MEVFLIILIGLVVFFVLASMGGKSKSTDQEQPEKRSSYQDYRKNRAEENLRIILANNYQKQKVCNRLERMAYLAALGIVLERQRKERVLAQVCLGEFLRHPDKRAHSAINSKRADVLVCDDDFLPLVAIEIDGSGHNMSGLADINDEGKAHALRSAGVALIRIAARGDDVEIIRKEVRARLQSYFAGEPTA
jgi:hypothetical protein